MTRSITLGIYSPDLGVEYYSLLLGHLIAKAQAIGWRVLCVRTGSIDNFDLPIALSHADGWVTLQKAVSSDFLSYLIHMGKPLVSIGCYFDIPGAVVIESDNEDSAAHAVNELIAAGHRHIAFIGHLSVYDIARRLDGYRRALNENKLPYRTGYVLDTEGYGRGGGRAVAQKILAQKLPITALFVGNDRNAAGAIACFRANGLRVPEDIAVIGYDNASFSPFCDPPLATIDQNFDQMAERAVTILMDQIYTGQRRGGREFVKSTFIPRHSCGFSHATTMASHAIQKNSGKFAFIESALSFHEMGRYFIGGLDIDTLKSKVKSLEPNIEWESIAKCDDPIKKPGIVTIKEIYSFADNRDEHCEIRCDLHAFPPLAEMRRDLNFDPQHLICVFPLMSNDGLYLLTISALIDLSNGLMSVLLNIGLFAELVAANEALQTEIIERKNADEKLRRSEALLAQAQTLSHTGSFRWSICTGEIFWSEETFRIFEFDPGTKLSMELVLQRVHPEDLPLVQQALDLASRDVANLNFEHRLIVPGGAIKYVHVVGRAVKGPIDSIEFIGAIMDVTTAKLALQEIQALKDRLQQENVALREEVDAISMYEEIVGAAPALRAVLSRVSKVAPTDSTVLITGETGTGKELIARAIHKRSGRSDGPFVSVNCAAIPPSLIASELFGHEKGAFTGALQRRLGRFELANGGTLFLDEVGELPADMQVMLLRVLQEHEFERLGGTQVIRTNARLIAATNRDLKAEVASGHFRSDLFFRLNIFPIEMPSLVARKEDIPLLTEYFIHRYAGKLGKKISSISKRTLERFQSYAWPGNIRELQNVVERSLIICEGDTFSVDESWLVHEPTVDAAPSQPLSDRLAGSEKAMIEAALSETRGRIAGPSGAAAKLGMPASTLESKIRALKIDKYAFKSG